MSNAQELLQERLELREDLVAHKVPGRVPMYLRFSAEAACGLAGVDLMRAHYDIELMEKAYTAVCDTFVSDANPCSNIRFPASYQLLGARNWILSSSGVMQHPEIEIMQAEEYDEYTAEPYTFIVEKLLPRACGALDKSPAENMLAFARAQDSYRQDSAKHGAVMAKLNQKYGYGPGMAVGGGMIEAPFDFLADQLRGFKGILMDVRKRPEKIEEAIEATLPLMVKLGTPAKIAPGATNFCPLHLAPYINGKAFERLWWPSFLEMSKQLDAKGVGINHYCEQDFTRYGEFLAQMPTSNSFLFEDGDYAQLKKTAGKDHVIGGFYDPTITLVKTKEECIDAAKRLLDVCMEGGQYYFAFDKTVMDSKSIDTPKLVAVVEWVRDNAKY
ncbi:uroporphyrinogen decarboxylase [Clostridia bacterium OttesenSCG-928-O13]|nr:uroporphyrinogen decarboxylase [Clostridia bacterium OttesenSCG-928-O13]